MPFGEGPHPAGRRKWKSHPAGPHEESGVTASTLLGLWRIVDGMCDATVRSVSLSNSPTDGRGRGMGRSGSVAFPVFGVGFGVHAGAGSRCLPLSPASAFFFSLVRGDVHGPISPWSYFVVFLVMAQNSLVGVMRSGDIGTGTSRGHSATQGPLSRGPGARSVSRGMDTGNDDDPGHGEIMQGMEGGRLSELILLRALRRVFLGSYRFFPSLRPRVFRMGAENGIWGIGENGGGRGGGHEHEKGWERHTSVRRSFPFRCFYLGVSCFLVLIFPSYTFLALWDRQFRKKKKK